MQGRFTLTVDPADLQTLLDLIEGADTTRAALQHRADAAGGRGHLTVDPESGRSFSGG
ncbi:MAG: hypothetical protein U0559_02500 [Anaerolineae bacterium]